MYHRVSVIIPTYNRKHLLTPALTSVLEQTYPNIETFIVDDCSTDGTSDWIKQNYPSLNLISLERNLGAAGARNVGLEAASGDYIAFLDSDDYWNPDYIEKAIDALSKEPKSSFVFCNHREHFKDSGRDIVVHYAVKEKYRDLIHRSLADVFIYTMSVVVARTSAIHQIGPLNEKLDICHDRELYIRLLEVGNMIHIPETLVTRVIHSNNISSDYRSWAKYVFVTLDIFFSTPRSRKYKDLESEIRSEWAFIIAREIWQNERDWISCIWIITKALAAAPEKTFYKLQSKFLNLRSSKLAS